jgi:hypothetical protein
LMAHEVESESVTGPVQGVEILNQEIHFSDMAHDCSFGRVRGFTGRPE